MRRKQVCLHLKIDLLEIYSLKSIHWKLFIENLFIEIYSLKIDSLKIDSLIIISRLVHGIHMGADNYWKRSIRTMISLKDFYYNKEIVRTDYPWTSLVYSNYTTGKTQISNSKRVEWKKSFLVLEKNI